MRDSVHDVFLAFTERWEGGVSCPYADRRGLMTVAFGNLIEPLGMALVLPFVRPDGVLATDADITYAWHTVKNDPLSAIKGWKHAAKLTDLRLPYEEMVRLFWQRATINDNALRRLVSGWDERNACVQLALHSWAWAGGPGMAFPRMMAALADHDYVTAAEEIKLKVETTDGAGKPIINSGLIPRNRANRILLLNAAKVDAYHLDPDLIEWLNELGEPGDAA